MTYHADLVDPEEVSTAIRSLSEQVVEDITREGRACARVHLKVRFAPFFTTTRIRKLVDPTFDPDLIAATALDLLTGLADERPIRLLGVRAEMVPPEGGYRDPRTTGRGGPAARHPGEPLEGS
jgi:DNA polymerase IV